MANFVAFDQGTQYLATSGKGLPATCYFLLSGSAVDNLPKTCTLGGGVGEIAGTAYSRQTQAAPTPTNGTALFTAVSWSTSSHTDWPASVKSCVLATTTDNSGTAVCAWNLYGGTARDMSAPNTVEEFTPTLILAS